MNLSVFREKGEISLTTPELNLFCILNKTHEVPPESFLSPLPHPKQNRIEITETPSVAFTGGRRKSWYRLIYMCTDTLANESKADILWYALKRFHI